VQKAIDVEAINWLNWVHVSSSDNSYAYLHDRTRTISIYDETSKTIFALDQVEALWDNCTNLPMWTTPTCLGELLSQLCRADNVVVVRKFCVFSWILSVYEKKTEVTWSQDSASDHRSDQALAAIQNAGFELHYSVTHRIRHSCSYCTANGWLEDQE